MGDNLPLGVSYSTPPAPWNDPGPEECRACLNQIARIEDHAKDCPKGDISRDELIKQREEAYRAEKAEVLREHRNNEYQS